MEPAIPGVHKLDKSGGVSISPPRRGGRAPSAAGADAPSILLVLTVAVVLGLPMLLYGPLVDGHDTAEHLNLTRHFTEQFWSGDLYPRWLVDINHGLGSPSYFVFPPLPAYVSALLDPLCRAFHLDSFNIAAFLALLASGISAFVFLRSTANSTQAALGAALYMAMPYHLVIDYYRRCAISECWALAWMPLVLFFVPGAISGKRRAITGLAVSYALMIFSHLLSVAMFSPIPLLLVFFLAPTGLRIRAIFRVATGMALGVGISSVYLFPALASGKYISAARLVLLWIRTTGANGLVGFGRAVFSHPGSNERLRFLQLISWADISTMALAAVCVFAMRPQTSTSGRDSVRLTKFWVAVCCFAVFMTSRLSAPIWRNFSWLHRAIQFPWRFSAILCLGALALLGLLFSQPPGREIARSLRLRFAFPVIAICWLLGYGYIWWRYKVDTAPSPTQRSVVVDHDTLFWAWSPSGMDPDVGQEAALVASAGPKARFMEASGSAEITLWKPRQIEFESRSSTGGWVRVTQFYYPAWGAKLKRSAASMEIRTAMPEGLIEVRVPAGIQQVSLEIPALRTERIGRWLGVFSALLCVLLSFRGQQVKPTA